MTNGLELIKIDFDNMENHNPQILESVAIFSDSKICGLSAHGRCGNYIKENFNNVKMYLGYDGRVYPQFYIKKIKINE